MTCELFFWTVAMKIFVWPKPFRYEKKTQANQKQWNFTYNTHFWNSPELGLIFHIFILTLYGSYALTFWMKLISAVICTFALFVPTVKRLNLPFSKKALKQHILLVNSLCETQKSFKNVEVIVSVLWKTII